ncbi:MAG: radical SAM family heme chaperone HemW [Clostridia bacterium]|jgi:oxygen-independent coproporphyrinogen-3 oxidase|nr:radical SAM family heme chaperone HemW [Clostridia bacterium]MCI2000900.1 radical SAM family heme chaperone HemW [Clostridia bacterium]MCI2015684.1 radical SAM family heme chaperone HemW [Clostridia bacterium]
MKQPLSIYIHIPFCVKKCLYCDFPSFAGCENIYDDYVSALCSEISDNASVFSDCEIKTIFIGGGTPTVLSCKNIGKIMDSIIEKYNVSNDAEITSEANPETVDFKKLSEMRSMYINRLSMGVQAWQDRLLKKLGRIHTRETFVANFNEARRAGFKNINCDLMFSLPSQTMDDWEETLENVLKLKPEHISAYSLIIEDGTPFKKMFDEGCLNPIDDDIDRKMYYLCKEMLSDKGYKQYEISNFAKPGFECRHNCVYWQTQEYVGFGLAAHSYFNGKRFHNTLDMKKYIEAKGSFNKLHEDIEILSEKEKIEEFMFMGLRMNRGIEKEEFKNRFNFEIDDIYKNELCKLKEEKLINENNGRIFLTEYGMDVSNYVFEEFIK